MDFQAVKGDITTIKTDAVVLPANTGLKEGSGASEAIFSKAGRKELTAACKALAPVEVGSAIATPAYNLSAEYILHAVVPKWQGGTKNEYALLSSAYLSCLTVADAMGCESIAFPLLAAGNNGFNLRLAIQIAKETISGYQPENQLKTVFLVVYTEAAKVMMIGSGILVHPMIILRLPRSQKMRRKKQRILSAKSWPLHSRCGKIIKKKYLPAVSWSQKQS